MPRERRNFSGAEKIAILREHLIEKVPISQVCDQHGIQPTLFYLWQKKLFEDGAAVFEQPRAKSPRQRAAEQRRIDALEAKVREKNEVLAELMGEHVALKKSLGEI
jgi:transposase-like protein